MYHNVDYVNDNKSNCCGCRACEYSCPSNCIVMQPDAEGFIYPKVNWMECSMCNKCLHVCPMVTYNSISKNEPAVYCAWAMDEEIRNQSSSGGVGALISENIIENGGSVFGAAYDDCLRVRHIEVVTNDRLSLLKGSKYVQSDTEDTYSRTEVLLRAGNTVLYTGLPCQIAGLKNFLTRDYDNLFLVDLVCHGVPSPKLFKDYIQVLSKRYNGRITDFSFRDKSKFSGPVSGRIVVKCKDRDKIIRSSYKTLEYFYAFEYGYTLRDSCYECPYAGSKRTGDITLGDFWGAEQVFPDVLPEKGISLVLVNTPKGNILFNKLKQKMLVLESDLKSAIKNNKQLVEPSEKPALRKMIYEKLYEGDFNKNMKKYFRPKGYYLYKCYDMIPLTIKKKLKKAMRK